jgi:hypothetical protein
MNTTQPTDAHILVRWSDLETAWHMLAAPGKLGQVSETVAALKAVGDSAGPEKAVFTMIAATAWLTDDGPDLK